MYILKSVSHRDTQPHVWQTSCTAVSKLWLMFLHVAGRQGIRLCKDNISPHLGLILSHCHFQGNTIATDVFSWQFCVLLHICTQVSTPVKKDYWIKLGKYKDFLQHWAPDTNHSNILVAISFNKSPSCFEQYRSSGRHFRNQLVFPKLAYVNAVHNTQS